MTMTLDEEECLTDVLCTSPEEALAYAKLLLREAGWQVSSASWAGSDTVYAFSREGAGPCCFGAPCADVTGRRRYGRWSFTGPTRQRSEYPADWKW